MKILRKSLSILLTFALLISALAFIFVNSNAQLETIKIQSLSSFIGKKGSSIEVRGGTFVKSTRTTHAVVSLGDDKLDTFYFSDSSLVFVVPPNVDCGENELYVINPGSAGEQSNSVVFNVDCSPSNQYGEYAAPIIKSVSRTLGLASNDVISIEAVNLIPFNESGMPYTRVSFRTRDLQGEFGLSLSGRYLGFTDFDTASFQLLDEGRIPCGVYELSFTNIIPGGAFEEYSSNVVELTISEDCRQGYRIEISNVTFSPNELEAGEHLRINYEIDNFGSAPTGPYEIVIRANEIEFARLDRDPLPAGENISGSSFRSFDTPGTYTIYVEALGESVAAGDTLTVTPATGTPNEELPPPPPVIGGNLSDYDLDNDCSLSDGEFFNMIDAWIGESIENLLFFSGVDAWIGQTSICASTASSSISLSATPQGILISNADNSEIGPFSIFDINGRSVFQSYTNGKKLLWKMQSELGERVANGVYIVRFGKTDELRKFVVLR